MKKCDLEHRYKGYVWFPGNYFVKFGWHGKWKGKKFKEEHIFFLFFKTIFKNIENIRKLLFFKNLVFYVFFVSFGQKKKQNIFSVFSLFSLFFRTKNNF